jgi:hypothetical protein
MSMPRPPTEQVAVLLGGVAVDGEEGVEFGDAVGGHRPSGVGISTVSIGDVGDALGDLRLVVWGDGVPVPGDAVDDFRATLRGEGADEFGDDGPPVARVPPIT